MAELIELQTLEASDDRIWCVSWNPTGTLYEHPDSFDYRRI